MAQPNTDLRKQTLMRNANKNKNSSLELVDSDEEKSFLNHSNLSLETPPKYLVQNSMFNGSLSPVSNDDNTFDYLASSPDVPASCSTQSSPSSNDDNSFDYLCSSPDVPASSSSPQSSSQGSPRSHCKSNSPLCSLNYEHESPKSPTGYPWLSPTRMQGDANELDLDIPKAKKLKTKN